MQPLLSIVVLVYNTSEYLAECFDSLLAQSYSNIEILAIDDSSTDDSFAICREYEKKDARFRCLRKPNEGGAVVGNLGMAMAKGEYLALVDSDDVVTRDGYSLLMAEAIANDADIVVGRAARLTDGQLSAVSFLYEPFVWTHRLSIERVADFPDLIHDGFYWNKVFRTQFLRKHELGMVPGLLYADRPFVHQAYFFSQRTCVIPHLVYLWRTRAPGSEASITQSTRVATNFMDRMRSVAIEWNDFASIPDADWYRRLIAVTNLQRSLHVAHGVVGSPSFREVFVRGMRELLQLYGDLDYRALGPRRSLYLELLKRNDVPGLCYLLGLPVDGRVVARDGKCFWQHPFLDNAEVNIPNEVSRIFFPVIGFFKVSKLALTDHVLSLELLVSDEIMNQCAVQFELTALQGEGTVEMQFAGKNGPGRYGYHIELSTDDNSFFGLYGLVLKYQSGGIAGRYRIGPSLLQTEALAILPVSNQAGVALLYSFELGGVGIAVNQRILRQGL